MSGLEGIPNLDAQVAAAMQPMQPQNVEALEKYLSSEHSDLGNTPHEKAGNLTTLAGQEAVKIAETWFKNDFIQANDKKDFRDAVSDHLNKIKEGLNSPDEKVKHAAQAEREQMESLAPGLNNTGTSGNAKDSLDNFFQSSSPQQAKRFADNYTSIMFQETLDDYRKRVTPPPEQAPEQNNVPPAKPKGQQR